MELVNLVVELNPRNVGKELTTFHATMGCASVVLILNAPEDCDNFILRVFAQNGAAFYDFPCWREPNNRNSVKCRILGTAFPNAGVEHYEVRAKDYENHDIGFGTGKIEIGSFSAGTPEVLPATTRVVQTLPDAQGGLHPIIAVQDEYGQWTYQFQ